MTDPTKTKQVLATGRRRLIAAAGLASPMFFIRNGWAAGKSMYVGTYTGVQGEYMRRQVIPKFESNLACKIFQTENVTLGNIGIMRTQKANPNYSVMMMDDVGVPIAKGEGLIDRLPKDKIPNLAKVFPSFVYNDGYGAAFAISTKSFQLSGFCSSSHSTEATSSMTKPGRRRMPCPSMNAIMSSFR